ncbi:hypothetical protein D3C87_1826290 [compost metagenome]
MACKAARGASFHKRQVFRADAEFGWCGAKIGRKHHLATCDSVHSSADGRTKLEKVHPRAADEPRDKPVLGGVVELEG